MRLFDPDVADSTSQIRKKDGLRAFPKQDTVGTYPSRQELCSGCFLWSLRTVGSTPLASLIVGQAIVIQKARKRLTRGGAAR